MAEAHPVGFQWVMEAKARGAKVIHVDPRFTRTSAVADAYVPIRAGSDIAFLGGVINYILGNEKDFREYVVAYTNASFIVSEDYQDTEDLAGLFSGYDGDTATYDTRTWQAPPSTDGGPAGRLAVDVPDGRPEVRPLVPQPAWLQGGAVLCSSWRVLRQIQPGTLRAWRHSALLPRHGLDVLGFSFLVLRAAS